MRSSSTVVDVCPTCGGSGRCLGVSSVATPAAVDELLTSREALGVVKLRSLTALRRAVRERGLPVARVDGRRWLFSRQQLLEWGKGRRAWPRRSAA